MSAAFDTLKFVEKLEAGGFSPTQARAAAQAFADATGEQLATKGDIAAVRADLKETQLRLEMKIETTNANLKVDLPRWLVVTQIALAGFIFAAIRFVK